MYMWMMFDISWVDWYVFCICFLVWFFCYFWIWKGMIKIMFQFLIVYWYYIFCELVKVMYKGEFVLGLDYWDWVLIVLIFEIEEWIVQEKVQNVAFS